VVILVLVPFHKDRKGSNGGGILVHHWIKEEGKVGYMGMAKWEGCAF
jgi:hypothetical protein